MIAAFGAAVALRRTRRKPRTAQQVSAADRVRLVHPCVWHNSCSRIAGSRRSHIRRSARRGSGVRRARCPRPFWAPPFQVILDTGEVRRDCILLASGGGHMHQLGIDIVGRAASAAGDGAAGSVPVRLCVDQLSAGAGNGGVAGLQLDHRPGRHRQHRRLAQPRAVDERCRCVRTARSPRRWSRTCRRIGKDPTTLARDIEKALAKYIRDPVVTVIVTGFVGPYSEQIRVVGEAAKPQVAAVQAEDDRARRDDRRRRADRFRRRQQGDASCARRKATSSTACGSGT